MDSNIESAGWMTTKDGRQQHEAREIGQILGWALSDFEEEPSAEGTTKENASTMSTSEKIKLLRWLENDIRVSDDHRSDIKILLKEVDDHKFPHE